MNNIRLNRTNSINYYKTMTAAAKAKGGRILMMCACDVNTDNDCFVVVAAAEILLSTAWALHCTCRDGRSKWAGHTSDAVYKEFKQIDPDAFTFSIGQTYKSLPKNAQGDRSTALEHACMEYAKQWRPDLTWEYIGGHRESGGWRDLAARDANGKRVMLIEVKGRDGRLY